MPRPTVVLDLFADHDLARDLVAGGVFVPECTVGINEDCFLVVRVGDDELRVDARVVFVDPGKGAGLQILGHGPELREKIAALAQHVGIEPPKTATGSGVDLDDQAEAEAAATAGTAQTDTDDDAEVERGIPRNVHERLRNLPLTEQLRLAHKGEIHERIILERMYGKTVWEALLRNPKLTGPEVARIARMGALPRTLVELIVGNGTWLQIPEVRRSLLSNPKLGVDQILRVLRLLPKHELKLAAIQTAYPFAVRDAARRLFRDD
jgi:hypothetical protein